MNDIGHMLDILEKTASDKNKVPALTEFGYNGLPDSTWWTDTFWKALSNHHISYVLGWRNGGIKKDEFEYYVPNKGHASAKNFIEFYKNERTLFQNDIAKEKVYQ